MFGGGDRTLCVVPESTDVWIGRVNREEELRAKNKGLIVRGW